MVQLKALALLFALITFSAAQTCINTAVTKTGLCSYPYYTGLNSPRGLITASNGDILVVESGAGGAVSVLYTGADGKVTKGTLATGSSLNHGIAINGNYLYASSPSTVYRWPYTAGTRTSLGASQTVVNGIPDTHHTTRTLAFDSNNLLYVSVGSGSNVDPDSSRAGVYRWNLTSIPTGGFTWDSREIFTEGLRNEVGIRFHSNGQLWGVENGVDDLHRDDLGGDIHQQNPGEEMNILTKGQFYGYPYCWSQFNLTNVTTPAKTQYAQPDFMPKYTDAWCQNATNVQKPAYLFRAHTAPLDLIFYNGSDWTGYTGDAFVTSHGSWNRIPAAGYKVLHVKMVDGLPVSDEPIFWYNGATETDPNSVWYRPVSLTWSKCGGKDCLLVTSDTLGTIIALTWNSTCACATASPPVSTTTAAAGTSTASSGVTGSTATSGATASATASSSGTTATATTSAAADFKFAGIAIAAVFVLAMML